MKTRILRSGSGILIRRLFTIICVTLLVPVSGLVSAQDAAAPTVPAVQQARIPPEQLDSLVAPIALYPDPLLSQTLVASTYPLEIIQLHQWLERHKDLKDKALADAVSKKPWDPSIQAMAPMPDVVKRLADDIEWTTDLGNAFLAQQGDVMDAIQRMREKAQATGALKSNQYQEVETEVIDETKTVIVVRQADPEIVYVPSYNPLYVYGRPYYPYPEIYYPYYPYPYYPGMIAASAIYYGLGWAMGAAWGGGWGWNMGWGHRDIYVNHNNYFNRFAYRGGYGYRGSYGYRSGGNAWHHNPVHRGGAPYRDRNTADRFGGTARGDSLVNRQAGARQQLGRQGGNLPSTRDRSGVIGDRSRTGGSDRLRAGGVTDRSRAGGVTDRSRTGGVTDRSRTGGVTDRSRTGGVTDRSRTGGVTDRSRTGGVSDRSRTGGFSGGGGDRVGSRNVGRSSGGNRTVFGGGSRGYSGGSARASSSRGSSSMGGSRGGGSRGGSSRGGGGGRRR